MTKINWIDKANEIVSISFVCRMLSIDVPDDIPDGRSFKTFCPNGELYHSDAGDEPAMRVYGDTNSAYCFRCSMAFTPVWMAAQAWDIKPREAAEILLEKVGYKKPTFYEMWNEIKVPVSDPVDRSMLAVALKMYCARIYEDWNNIQFSPLVAGMLSKCLDLLERVSTSEDAEKWLSTCKIAMSRIRSDA